MNDNNLNDDSLDFNEFDINDVDQITKEIDKIEQDSINEKRKREKDKNYYVTNKELLTEIRKYRESKAKDPTGQRTYIRRTWNNDNENMHKIFSPSKILRILIQR